MNISTLFKMAVYLTIVATASSCNGNRGPSNQWIASSSIVLQDQGGFSVGGRQVKHDGTFDMAKCYEPDGQTAYGDHAYVLYQIPAKIREYPSHLLTWRGHDETMLEYYSRWS